MDVTDAARMLDELFAQTGQRLAVVGVPAVGETGDVAFVRWPDGRPGVIARSRRSKAELERVAELLEYVRGRGIPAPRYELIVELAECTLIVQERLPGEPTPTHLDRPTLAAILIVAESFRGLLEGWANVPELELALDGPSTASLAAHSDRSRLLLEWIRSVDARGPHITGNDLIHYDFHLDNFLFRDNVLTGIVDWHEERNLRRGDGRYHLVHLAFDVASMVALGWNTIEPAALALLDDALGDIDRETLNAYWAHDALRVVDLLLHRGHHVAADALIDFALRSTDAD